MSRRRSLLAGVAVLQGTIACSSAPPVDREPEALVVDESAGSSLPWRAPLAKDVVGAWEGVRRNGVFASMGERIQYLFARDGTFQVVMLRTDDDGSPHAEIANGEWKLAGSELNLDNGALLLQARASGQWLCLESSAGSIDLQRVEPGG